MSKSKKRKKAKESDWFDDCAVCLYMKSVEEGKKPPTLPELKQAFSKAKEKGALVVGGSMFEKDGQKN